MTGTAESPVADYHVFPSPSDIVAAVRMPTAAAARVVRSRDEVRAVLSGADDRLLVITGPCSVHDPQAALEYAAGLAGMGLTDDLLIVMRAYPEKPRTVTGWTGILNDPDLDGSHDVRRGFREARQLLVSLAMLGVPAAYEWVSPVVPSYLADAVAWSAIGARTTESQVHQHLASSLPMPVGFKNATDGDVQVAADASTPPQVATAITYALRQLGKPYIWGGVGPVGYDCSGLVMVAYEAAGISLPRTTFQQVDVGTPVYSLSQLQPGDLIFTAGSDETPDNPGHVGMYIGDSLVLQAPKTGLDIMITPLKGYWSTNVVAMRRIV